MKALFWRRLAPCTAVLLSLLHPGHGTGACADVPTTLPAVREARTFVVSPNGTDSGNDQATIHHPLASVDEALRRATAGDTVLVRAGTYRQSINMQGFGGGTEGRPVNLFAFPGDDRPVFKGSDIVQGWKLQEGQLWKHTDWPVNSQMVFVNGRPLQQVGMPSEFYTSFMYDHPVGSGLADMGPGRFFYDKSAATLYVQLADGSDPNTSLIEAAVRRRVAFFDINRRSMHIRGLAFMHSNGGAFAAIERTMKKHFLMKLEQARWFVAFLIIASSVHGAKANVKLAGIFGDHMVLQEDMKLPIWGWADPGEKVSVTFANQSGSAVAGSDGAWRVELPPVPQNTEAQTLTVTGKNTLTLQDVLVGDVWVASGQSNMDFGIGNDGHAAETIAQANEPQIRLFMVPRQTSLEPKSSFSAALPDHLEGTWRVCTPEILGGKWGWNGFSAVAYYFGLDIQHATHHPIGMIQTAWGGTPAATWTSIDGLKKDPMLAHYVELHQKFVDHFAQATADYPKLRAQSAAAYKQWNEEVGIPYQKELDQWNIEAAKASAAGKPVPKKPDPSRPKPPGLPPPDGGYTFPTDCFNGMVAPMIPYAIKGVIWLQGEADRSISNEYATLFTRLITDWREKWNEGDFPFLFVQLSNMNPPNRIHATEDYTAMLREAQSKALALPNTAMAVTIDIGSSLDIHYKDKKDAGERLALQARRMVYGEKNLVASGPVYDAMTIDGGKIRLTFKEIGSGLVLRVPPWMPLEVPNDAVEDAKELKGFAIAGEDHRFKFAKAQIDGDSVVVWADGLASPLAVRYDWQETPFGNLANKEGLPAAPFRTDDWDDAHLPPPKPSAAASQTSATVSQASIPAPTVSAAALAMIPTDAQIAAIAAILPAKPIGVGRPITDRAAWATAMRQPYFQKQLKDAADYATKPIPALGDEIVQAVNKTTLLSIQQVPFDMRTKRLNAFVIAECAQDDGKYLPLIEAELHAILTERCWSLSNANQIDLAVAARAWTVATTDYWLGDKLKPETRQLIRDEIRKRAFDKYEYDFKAGKMWWGWEMGEGGNWTTVCTSGVLGAALTLLDSPRDRAFYVQAAENSIAHYLKGMGDDGYCFEGVGYWGYGFGSYLCIAETLYDQTQGRINLYQGSKVRNLALFLTHMQMLPNVYAAWGDVWYRGNGSAEELAELINERWGMNWTDLDPAKSTMFATHQLGDRLFGFGIFGFPRPQFGDSMVAGSPASPDELASGNLRYFFKDGNALLTRSQRPGAPDLGLAVKGGDNGAAGGHSHNDNGTYYVATKGVPLVVDPGMEIYTRESFGPHRFESMHMNSYGHDVPYIGKTMQKAGSEAKGQITSTSFTDDKDTLTMDLTTSYNVPSLIKVTRTYVLDRTRPAVEITDTADFTQPTDYGSCFITGSKWKEEGPGSFLIYEKAAAVQATVTLDADGAALVNEVEPVKSHKAGAGYHPMRLGFNLDKPVTHLVMHTLIVPVPAPTAQQLAASPVNVH